MRRSEEIQPVSLALLTSELQHRMNPPCLNTYWLEPDRILCGQYPRDISDYADQQFMTTLLKSGVRVFVDLTEEGELKPYRDIALEKATSLGIAPEKLAFHRFAIQDVSIPRSPELMRDALQVIREARENRRIPYIHCWGGVGRTGTVAGCLLRELFGLNGEEALEALRKRWKTCAKSKTRPYSPETDQQRDYVRTWTPSLFLLKSFHGVPYGGRESEDQLPNLFQGIGERLLEEQIDLLAKGQYPIRIERIVSKGHASPKGFWYDQDDNEWVTLLSGAAIMKMKDPLTGRLREIRMKPGDWLLLPSGTRHRIEWTTPEENSVWLTIYW